MKNEKIFPMAMEYKKKDWKPVTELGRLVLAKKITLDDIFKYSMIIREAEIIDFLIPDLKTERLNVRSIQKQTKAGQRTRMKVCVAVGDYKGHVGVATASAVDVASAVRAAERKAKCQIKKINIGYWGAKVGEPHTIIAKSDGKCGSVKVSIMPAVKGSGIVAAGSVSKIYSLAGIKDVNSKSRGQTRTTENFSKATLDAIEKSSNFYTPEMWSIPPAELNPIIKFSNRRVSKKFKA